MKKNEIKINLELLNETSKGKAHFKYDYFKKF